MLCYITKSKKGNVNTEVICKVAYIPEIVTRYMRDEKSHMEVLFSYLGDDIKTIVKCYCIDLKESISEIGERRFLRLGLDNIHRVFSIDNTELSNALFIFNGITFEALSFVLLSKGITLHGGTHTRIT